MQKIPVFVISLVSAVERRELISTHLAGMGIEYEFIDAVKGSAIDQKVRTELNPQGNMLPSELGCYLSHMKAFEHIVDNNIPVALILEDDTVLHFAAKSILENGLAFSDFDYCFLGCDDHGDEGYVYYDSGKPIHLRGYPLNSA